MNRNWQLQEAKTHLGEVIDAALTEGPQVITRQGVETAVVLSYSDYRQLVLKDKRLSDFFRELPLFDSGIDLERDKTLPRRVFEL
jgi:prevent-host-death family protein